MRRIVVIGTSGSGKTTLARRVAERLNIPHIELDAIHWKPGWVSTPYAEMLPKVDEVTRGEAWASDGNYAGVRDLLWSRADTIIWLDYSMRVVFLRCLTRSLRRWWAQEELWNGNRERLVNNLCSRDSLLLWVINTWRIRRREYPKLLNGPKAKHARVMRFRTPMETENWLAGIKAPST